MKELSTEQRITRSMVAIMRSPDWSFLGGILKTGSIEPDQSVKTTYTDGFNIKYNPEYLSGLTEGELNHTFIHLGLHKAYRHNNLWKGLRRLDPKKLDQALDYQVNGEIENVVAHSNNSSRLSITRPGQALYDSKYIGMSTPEIFNILELDPSDDNSNGNDSGDGDGSSNHGGQDSHGFDGQCNMSPQDEQLLDTAIRQAAGQLPANRARDLQNANAVKRDWKELLQAEWASTVPGKDESSWAKVNPVYLSLGLYLPGTVSMSAKHVNFCIDTSGSITDEIIAQAASEVAYLSVSFPPETLQVIWWDTEEHVQPIAQEQYKDIKSILKPKGGGGTDPTCLDKHMLQETFNIILTDGYFHDYKPADPKTVFLIVEGGTDRYIKEGTVVFM